MSQVAAPHHAPVTANGDDGGRLHLTGVVLVGAAGAAAQAGLTLEIDQRGVVLSGPSAAERALPWHLVTGWQVAEWQPPAEEPGALVTYTTLRSTYRFAVPGADPAALGAVVEDLGRRHVPGASREVTEPDSPAPAPSAIETQVRRLRPLLVVLLIVVLAAMVTLLLLQSAGVIDIHWLGGNGSGVPSGLVLKAAGRAA